MTKFFKNNKKDHHPSDSPAKKPEKMELIDPVLFTGGLDDKKYPFLALEKEERIEEDVENPLNKR